MLYSQDGGSSWVARAEHSFHTQRLPGSTFTFTITSDSHINIVFGNPSLWQTTLLNVANDHPDFHLDLGDAFAMDNLTTQTQAYNAYLFQRPYFGLVSPSAPIFLAYGNHEQPEGWHQTDTGNIATSPPVMGANAQKQYFLNPIPDAFYSGNTDNSISAISGDHLCEDYYAWEWGNALFVVIDPFWYTTLKPYIGNIGGGETSQVGTGDRWDWTLGPEQYQWLQQTLANSKATFKFVFAHQVAGGTDDYGRGGANAVPYVEWGGDNDDGTTWAFNVRRPGWANPIHRLMVQNGVTAFFHGHDHEFAYEKRDGIVYQLLPMAADASYGYGFQNYHETDPYTIRVLPNSGHLRVTVSPSQATVDYVRAFLPGAGTNGQVAYTYTIGATSSGNTTPPGAPTKVTATAGNAQATVSFAPPASNGGSPITGYTVTSNPGFLTGQGAGSPLTVTGLTNGTTYAFTVTATNSAGTGPPSGPSTQVTPATVPGAPTNVTATAGKAQATVSFTPPASNGGSPITGYTVTSNPKGGVDTNAGSTSLSHIVTNLKSRTKYTFSVTASNAVGASTSKPSMPVTIK
jgi:hypothetical protein